MSFLQKILKEIAVFLRQCWFLVLLLILALLAYPAAKGNEFWVWSSLSYVTSFVFYVLTIYLPQRKNQKNIHRVILPYLQSIINDIKSIFYAFLAASHEKCDTSFIQDADIEKVFKIINPQEKSTRLEFLGFLGWFQYLQNQKTRIKRSMERILTYEHYLDTDFIFILEGIHNSAFFEILDFIENQPITHTDFGFLTDAYAKSHQQADQLEAFLKKYRAEI
jgi:hypothetical protein